MSITHAPSAPPTDRRESLRDTGIDFVRALCIVGVVLLHAMMVGVTLTPAGPVFENASAGAWWIVPLSWVLQVMPLFFVIGGFSGLLFYRRLRQSSGSAVGFVAARVHRLLRPALLAFAVVGVALALAALVGFPADLIAVAGFRYSQPLWFLGVFLFCQALLPALATAHERAPLRSIAALVAAAVSVDLIRSVSGIDALGFLNLAFVWMALQQLGFFFADGTIDRLSRRIRTLIGLGAVGALAVAFVFGVYSPDLIANVNPPTTALLLVGVAHTSALSLFREPLNVFGRRRVPAALTAFVTPRAMTIYLWHMPVLLAMAGVSAGFAIATGTGLPALGGPEWWLGRPAWLVIAFALVALVAMLCARAESARLAAPTRSTGRVAVAAVIGGAGVVGLIAFSATVATTVFAVALISVALGLSRAARRRAARPSWR
jgi:peptidoglycan/LPS O-acetylase OafA/YrhL